MKNVDSRTLEPAEEVYSCWRQLNGEDHAEPGVTTSFYPVKSTSYKSYHPEYLLNHVEFVHNWHVFYDDGVEDKEYQLYAKCLEEGLDHKTSMSIAHLCTNEAAQILKFRDVDPTDEEITTISLTLFERMKAAWSREVATLAGTAISATPTPETKDAFRLATGKNSKAEPRLNRPSRGIASRDSFDWEGFKAFAANNAWRTRRERGFEWKTNVFEFVETVYGHWIDLARNDGTPLTQADFAHVDKPLYDRLQQARQDEPSHFPVKAERETPSLDENRAALRAHWREAKRLAKTSPKLR